MSIIISAAVALIVAFGAWHIWRNRPKKAKGVNRADLELGRVPMAYRTALATMQRKVGERVTKYYTTENRTSRFSRPVGNPYAYSESWEQLVNRIAIVKEIPGNKNARGTMQRDANGIRTLTLPEFAIDDVGHVQHELLHSLQWDHEELMGPKGYDTKDEDYPPSAKGRTHWPVIFSELIGD